MLKKLIVSFLFSLSLMSISHAGDAAPDFKLRDMSGKEVSLSDYRGKVVLMNFWATWCQPCLVELPHLQEIYKELEKDGLVVLGISVDAPRDVSKVKPIVKTRGLEFPILLDKSSSVLSLYNPSQALPYNVLIDREGKVIWTKEAYAPGEEEVIKEKIVSALGLSDSAPTEPTTAPE
jgi:peroxiredoxin